jgi:3-oxoadipate enol-lactonase
MAEAAALEPLVALRRFVENALAPEAPDELVERILAHRVKAAQPLDGWLAQAAAGQAFDAWDRLPQIDASTLVLQGEQDVVVDPANARLLAARIPGARVEMFSRSGHLFFWEKPTRFVQVVSEFLT